MGLTDIRVGGLSQRDKNPDKMRETKWSLKYVSSVFMTIGFLTSGVYMCLTEGISLFSKNESNNNKNRSYGDNKKGK